MMTLRSKVLLILASMWAVILCIIIIDSRYTLIENYKTLEQKDVAENVDHADKAIDTMLSSLTLLTTDWAQWNDAYNFIQDKNQEFIKTNMAFTTFANAKINYILFFDIKGKFFYGQAYDLKKNKAIPVPQDLIHYFESHPEVIIHKNEKSSHTGIVKIQEQLIATSALPILTSQGTGPIRGTLIMAFDINQAHLVSLSEAIGIPLQLFSISSQNPSIKKAIEQLNNGKKMYVNPINGKTTDAFAFIYNFENRPIAVLRVQIPRVLFNEGLMTVYHYLAIVFSIGILIIILMWYLLKIFVLDRIISVSNQLIEINSESNFNKRIHISGKDEIGDMVAVMNLLMEIIELTQEQLKYRILQRNEQLERLSDLNKNLSSEINQQHTIENKLRANEKIFRQMAYYDSLTGLPNRFFFNEKLHQAIQQLNNKEMLAVLFLDVDKLKYINDTYGHEFGDFFIKHTAQQLKTVLEDDTILARLAGDEFILFLNHITQRTEIDRVAKKILHAISTPMIIGENHIISTCSIGISLYPINGTTVEELQKNADLAMYYAKKQSGNSYYFYDAIY